MNFYRVIKFSSGLKGSKREEKPPKMMRVLNDPAPQKRTQKFEKLVSWPAKVVAWVSEMLLGWQKSTKKVFDRFCIKYSTWRILDPSSEQCARRYRLVCECVLCKAHHALMDYPLYSSDDVTPMTFVYIKRSNLCWKGQAFRALESAKAALTPKKLTEEDFQYNTVFSGVDRVEVQMLWMPLTI